MYWGLLPIVFVWGEILHLCFLDVFGQASFFLFFFFTPVTFFGTLSHERALYLKSTSFTIFDLLFLFSKPTDKSPCTFVCLPFSELLKGERY